MTAIRMSSFMLSTLHLLSYISQADSRIYCAANFSRGGEDCLFPSPLQLVKDLQYFSI